MFQADQMHATKSKVVSRIKQNPNYHPTEGGDIRKFEDLLKKMYVPAFPHTAILGSELGNAAKWLQFKSLLQNFSPATPDYSTVASYYDKYAIFENEAVRVQKAQDIVKIMEAGGQAITTCLTDFFNSNNPI